MRHIHLGAHLDPNHVQSPANNIAIASLTGNINKNRVRTPLRLFLEFHRNSISHPAMKEQKTVTAD
jgi:hypothetical protein